MRTVIISELIFWSCSLQVGISVVEKLPISLKCSGILLAWECRLFSYEWEVSVYTVYTHTSMQN